MTLEDLAENKFTRATTCCHLKTSHLYDVLVKTLQCMEEKQNKKNDKEKNKEGKIWM